MKYNFIKFFIIFFFIIFLNSKVSISETSQDKIFKVKNISVNVESTSSFKAKEIAILEAQEKGFKNLMNKMLLESEYKKIGSIKINKILILPIFLYSDSKSILFIKFLNAFRIRI